MTDTLIQIALPKGAEERRLVKLAQQIADANHRLLRERDSLLRQLNEAGVSQRRLAELVTLGNLAGGGRSFSEPGVQRAVAKQTEAGGALDGG